MVVDVASLHAAPDREWRGAYRESIEVTPDTGLMKGPVVGGLVVTLSADGSTMAFHGDFQTSMQVVCHWCAESYDLDLDVVIDEVFSVVPEPPSSTEVDETVWARGGLDVDDLVRQHVILALPARQHCGCPLPTAQNQPPLDPRWRKLADLGNPRPEETEDHGTA
ncbi:MAG: YceD family protein [Candidatus Sericytochromatia bacterium]|nr:YceD family protein [Candidatus Sericytochromatia bacterium]